MKSQPTTAAAVAASFGLPLIDDMFAGRFSDLVDRQLNESKAQRASRLAGAPIERLDSDLIDLSDAEVQTRIARHEKQIANIRRDATQHGVLSARDSDRLDTAEESLACFLAEADAREQEGRSAGRKCAPNMTAGMTNETGTSAPGRNVAGVLLAGVRGSASAAIFGSRAGSRGAVDTWRNPDEFFASLRAGIADPRLMQAATGTTGVGADGGFVVPSTWYNGVIDTMLQESVLASRCRMFGTASNDLHIPMLDTTDRRTSIAGIAANWVGEATPGTSQKLKFRSVYAKLNKIMILAEASNELLEDGINYAAQLEAALASSTSYTLDEAILEGNGVGKPLGILNSASAIEIEPEAAQAADSIVYANLVAMYSRAHPVAQRNGIWLYSPNALPQLLQMTIPGTDGHPVLLSGGPNDAAAGAPAQTIFGRPAFSLEFAPQLGDRGDMVFVDLSQYALLMKDSARVAYDAAPGFDSDVATWRLTLRADGQPTWSTPITPRNGGPSLSWATVLAARS